MPTYLYAARDLKTGQPTTGALSALSTDDLAHRLRAVGYLLIRARAELEKKTVKAASGRLKKQEVILFTLHLAVYLGAGVSLLEALRNLGEAYRSKRLLGTIRDLHDRVHGGSSFSEALSAHPRNFSRLYVGLIRGGEATGKLDGALTSLAGYLEWQADLQAKIKEASIYPIMLICGLCGVIAVLIGKVVPTFKPFFVESGIPLPAPTLMVLALSDVFAHYWLPAVVIIVGLAAACKAWYNTPWGRYTLDSVKLRLPLFGGLIRSACLSRFTHTLSLNLTSGVPLLEALETAADVTGNARLARAVLYCRRHVSAGEELAASMETTQEFPPLVVNMVRVGEQSGSLAMTLGKISEFFDKEVPATIKKLFVIMEPLMIAVIGIVVGGIALAVFMPLFTIAQTIGG